MEDRWFLCPEVIAVGAGVIGVVLPLVGVDVAAGEEPEGHWEVSGAAGEAAVVLCGNGEGGSIGEHDGQAGWYGGQAVGEALLAGSVQCRRWVAPVPSALGTEGAGGGVRRGAGGLLSSWPWG